MPNYIGYSPWSDAANVAGGAASQIGQMMLQIPQLRLQQEALKGQLSLIPYQAQEAQARTGAYNAQAGAYSAHAQLYGAQAGDIATSQQGLDNMAGGLAQMWHNVQSGAPIDDASINQVTHGLVHMAKNNPEHLAEFVRQMIATSVSGMGTNPQLAAGVINPQLIRGENVPPNNVNIDPVTGQPRMTGLQDIAPGHERFGAALPGTPPAPVATNLNFPPHEILGSLGNILATVYGAGGNRTNAEPTLRQVYAGTLGSILQQLRAKTAPGGTGTNAVPGAAAGTDYRAQAIEAMKTKDPAAVRARYEQLTGQKADF